MNTSYRLARLMDAEELTMMSMEFYNEIRSHKDLTNNRIVATLRFYEAHSDMGEVLMIEADGGLAGYSIVFRFWSNEYGGMMLGIDELFIKKQFRRQGAAKAFMHALIEDEKRNPLFAGIEMEGQVQNHVAGKLFESLGISRNENTRYIKLFHKTYK